MPGLAIAVWLVVASATPNAAVSTERELRRTRAGVSAGAGGMLLGQTALPGFGLLVEAGVVFVDRLSTSVRFSVSFVGAFELGVTLGGDYAINDSIAVGLGVSGKMLAASFVATAIMTPARLTWSPLGRKATQVERSGLVFGLELAIGTVVSSSAGPGGTQLRDPLLVGSGSVTVGYAVW